MIVHEGELFKNSVAADNILPEPTSAPGANGRDTVRSAQAKLAALRALLESRNDAGIVYAATVREAERLSAGVHEWRMSGPLYHGRISARERHDAQDRFISRAFRESCGSTRGAAR